MRCYFKGFRCYLISIEHWSEISPIHISTFSHSCSVWGCEVVGLHSSLSQKYHLELKDVSVQVGWLAVWWEGYTG